MENKKRIVTRRDFIRGTVGITLGASLMGSDWLQAGQKKGKSSQVIVVRDQAAMDASNNVDIKVLEQMLERTLMKLTGKSNLKESWLSLVSPTDMIGLVPTKTLIAAGIPKGRIIDAQGGPEKPKACTALIALPGLKAHWLTGIGTVLKNYILYSGNPRNYHRKDSAKLAEIWKLPFVKGKTKLVLVDALYPLCDKGPQPDPRYKWAYNGFIAGIDPVAVDTVCLKIIAAKREALRGEPWPLSPPPLCIEAADKVYNLGNSRMDKINITHVGWTKDRLV